MTHALQNNPFPGLRAYEPDEASLFFGRSEALTALSAHFKKHRFTAVVGPRGCGKSSLVKAGLLPMLRAADEGTVWKTAIFEPAAHPIHSLVQCLIAPEVFGSSAENLSILSTILDTSMRRHPEGLIEALRHARLREHEKIAIVVDQFDQLFRYRPAGGAAAAAEEECAVFTRMLIEASRQSELPVHILITLPSSGFLDKISQCEGLAEAITEGQFLLPALSRDHLREIMTAPLAAEAGISSELINRMLSELDDEPDQLLRLQFTLAVMWENRQQGAPEAPFDVPDYEAAGGVAQSLAQYAGALFIDLSEPRRRLAQALFRALLSTAPDPADGRRALQWPALCEMVQAGPDEVAEVVAHFRRPGRAVLRVLNGSDIMAETWIDLAYENLIRCWPALAEFAPEQAPVVATKPQKSLRERLALPSEPGKKGQNHDLLQAAADLEQKYAQALAEEQALFARRLRRSTIAIVFLSFLAIAATMYAYRQRQAALDALALAEFELIRAEQAEQSRPAAPAMPATTPAAPTARADSLQMQSTASPAANRLASAQPGRAAPAKAGIAGPSQAGIATRDDAEKSPGSAGNSVATPRAIEPYQMRRLAVALVSSAAQQVQTQQDTLGALLALQAFAYDSASGRLYSNQVFHTLQQAAELLRPDLSPRAFVGHRGSVTSVAVFPSGVRFATGAADSTALLWRFDSTRPERSLVRHDAAITQIAVSADGRRLASASEDYTIKVSSLQDWTGEAITLRGHTGRVWSVSFQPAAKFLLSGSADGTVRLWNLSAGTNSKIIGRHEASVRAVRWRPDGRGAASGGTDQKIILYHFAQGQGMTVQKTIQLPGIIRSLAFSPDSRMLAAGCGDQSVRLFRLDGSRTASLTGHRKRINDVAFSPSGTLLASGGSDRTIRIWRLSHPDLPPIVLQKLEAPVKSIAFTPDSERLVCGFSSNRVRVYVVDPKFYAAAIRRTISRRLTAGEWRQFVGADIAYPHAPVRRAQK